MKEILILSVGKLNEELFIAFMIFILSALDKFEVLSEKFGFYVNQFKAAYNHMNKIYLKYDLKTYTKAVQEKDAERIVAYRKFRDFVRYNLTYPESEEKGKAAGILLEIMDLYGGGNIPKKKMNERTTVLTNLVEDCEEKYLAQVEAINAQNLLADLKDAQQAFNKVYMERAEFDSKQALQAMSDARKRMADAYRELVVAINLAAKRDVEEVLSDFIDLVNTEIRKYFIHTGQSSNNASSGSGQEGEGERRTKTATFNFKNGNSIKLKLEVGAPIEAPANTEGYMWKPEVPEFMPDKNRTFKEVPLVEAEATATFHYLDHTEEEIRQIVGSILTAPANTAGCIWVPEVPATMPAEDTSYFEQQVSSGGGTGGEEQEPTKYWIAFVFADGTQEDAQYAEGATINYPTPTTGYRWPASAPTVMPAHDVTVTEERNPNQPPPATGGGESGFD